MAIKFTAESFIEIVKRSRLVAQDQLQRVLAEAKEAGVNTNDSREIAELLVEKTGLTRWQADKLLQGKHKGFFLGKYRLLSLLGKGGMGSVYLAEHTLMRRRCAIKVLPAKRVNDTSYLGRFHREAQAVAALDHSNIVRAYDVDKEDEGDTEIHFLVMEFVDGRSLLDIVLKDGPMGYVEAADYIRQSADGLTHAHKAGMVHRDIKPGNLLVDANKVVKILDLGLARFFGVQGDEESLTVAHDEKVLGTADYLSPEQALDSHTVDARADIYSLGCTFYFLLTGHPPFTEGTLAQRLMAHQTREPPPLENECPEVPAELLAIIKRMMAKSVDDRYQSAAEVNDALKNWLLQNADDDWRVRNTAIVGGDSSTAKSQRDSSPGGSGVPADAPTESEETAAVADSVAEAMPVPDPEVPPPSPKIKNESEDGDLAAFLTNLDSELTGSSPKAGDSGASRDSGSKVAAESDSGRQPEADSSEVPSAERVDDDDSGVPVAQPPAEARPIPAMPVPAHPVPAPPTGEMPAVHVAVPVAEAVPVATAEPDGIPERSFANRGKKKRRSGRRNADMFVPLIALAKSKQVRTGAAAAVGIGLLVAVAIAGMSLLGGDDEPEPEQPVVENIPTGDDPVDPVRKTMSSGTIQVGPSATYKTIGAALKFAIESYEPGTRRSTLTIEVASGTYAERIQADSRYPNGIQIVAAQGARPVLAPSGSDPVISLESVERLSISGFDVNAKGKPAAVKLSGYVNAAHLSDLKLTGFTKTGVLASGAVGVGSYDQEVKLENIDFHAVGTKAVGIRIQQGSSLDSAQIKVNDCRFYGPLAVGILFQNSPSYVDVRGSIFAELETGILFDGSNMRLKHITIGNCTFYKLDRGIVFTDLPSSESTGLAITRNLFSELKGLEVVVEEGFEAKTMYTFVNSTKTLPTGWNWTTRAATPKPAPGEFDVFSSKGKRGAKIDFATTDPGSDRFLAPPAGAPWAAGLPPEPDAGLKPYIGGVGP